jgi:hypothetical protein
MHAFLQTLQLKSQPVHFAYFPDNKNGNFNSQKGRLLGQSSKAKGTPFSFNSSFYVDDSFFLFQSKEQLHQAIIELDKHFARFGLIMHLGSSKIKSKSEAMFFPPASNKQRRNSTTTSYLTNSSCPMTRTSISSTNLNISGASLRQCSMKTSKSKQGSPKPNH